MIPELCEWLIKLEGKVKWLEKENTEDELSCWSKEWESWMGL